MPRCSAWWWRDGHRSAFQALGCAPPRSSTERDHSPLCRRRGTRSPTAACSTGSGAIDHVSIVCQGYGAFKAQFEQLRSRIPREPGAGHAAVAIVRLRPERCAARADLPCRGRGRGRAGDPAAARNMRLASAGSGPSRTGSSPRRVEGHDDEDHPRRGAAGCRCRSRRHSSMSATSAAPPPSTPPWCESTPTRGLTGWGEAKVSAGSSGDYHGVVRADQPGVRTTAARSRPAPDHRDLGAAVLTARAPTTR